MTDESAELAAYKRLVRTISEKLGVPQDDDGRWTQLLDAIAALREDADKVRAEVWRLEAEDQAKRVVELERRARLALGTLPCGGCGGPHRFDTSVPSVAWNAVIRARGMSEYLCASCILRAFVIAGRSFTATLWGDDLRGVPVEFRVNDAVANDATAVLEENNRLRAALAEVADWLPIDSAPKDGTLILAWSKVWLRPGLIRWGLIYEGGAGVWRDGTVVGYWGTSAPSHWLPIPPPPGGEA